MYVLGRPVEWQYTSAIRPTNKGSHHPPTAAARTLCWNPGCKPKDTGLWYLGQPECPFDAANASLRLLDLQIHGGSGGNYSVICCLLCFHPMCKLLLYSWKRHATITNIIAVMAASYNSIHFRATSYIFPSAKRWASHSLASSCIPNNRDNEKKHAYECNYYFVFVALLLRILLYCK